MGNGGSSGSGRRRHRNHAAPENPSPAMQPQPQPQPPLPDSTVNRFVFAAATPYPTQYGNPPPFFHYPGYYPPPAVPPVYPHQFRMGSEVFPGGYMAGGWGGAVRPHPGGGSGAPLPGEPYVDHQKAVTIRNDVNVKKESLRIEPDEENPGSFLVAFTFDAIAPGSITVMFFAKEDVDCNLVVTKENAPKAVTLSFEQGLGQKFRQPSGTGIDFSAFDETELTKGSDSEFYPLVVKAEACALNSGENENEPDGTSLGNTQITQGVFEKEKGQFHVRVMKQILWVNKMRYELQEIFGIGNSVDDDSDGNDSGKECVICLSEPRDTAVLPCRHMCMCSGCAKLLRFQTDQCPICRQLVERLLEIKVNNTPDG